MGKTFYILENFKVISKKKYLKKSKKFRAKNPVVSMIRIRRNKKDDAIEFDWFMTNYNFKDKGYGKVLLLDVILKASKKYKNESFYIDACPIDKKYLKRISKFYFNSFKKHAKEIKVLPRLNREGIIESYRISGTFLAC